jgi:hypothetical protein
MVTLGEMKLVELVMVEVAVEVVPVVQDKTHQAPHR